MSEATAPRADDSRHSVLRRAHAVAQSRLDAFAPQGGWTWAPPSERGTYEIKEVEARSALTPLGMAGGGWSLNPYTGCSHACLYCYVPDVTRVERERYGSYVIVKRNLPALLAREVRRKVPDEVFLSSATDPYQPVEADAQVTRLCLEVLARADWPLRVLTRSPLVLRDLDLLRRFSNVKVGLSIPTLDDEVRRAIEPSAPPIEGRLRTLRRLHEAGLETFVSLAPTYPLTAGYTPEDYAEALAATGVKSGWASAWRYMDTVRAPLRERVAGTPHAELAERVEDAAYYRHFMKRLEHACARRGIALSTFAG